MPSAEDLKLVQRFYEEVLNDKKMDVIDEIMTPDYFDHGTGGPGLDIFRQYLAMITTVFPDLNATVEDMIMQGDKVAVRLAIQGTQAGDFRGYPATNKFVIWTGMDFIRLANNKIVERWSERDFLGMLQRLGYAKSQG